MKNHQWDKEKVHRIHGICRGLDEEGRGLLVDGAEERSVPMLLPGEEVLVEVREDERSLRSKVLERKTTSLDRVVPPCSVFGLCGGCQLQHIAYPAQLRYKEDLVRGLLSRYGEVSPILGMKDPWHYRNKILSTLSLSPQGRIQSGIYEEDSHRVVPVTTCQIQDEAADPIIASVLRLMGKFRLRPYEEDRGKGFLRHILIRRGVKRGEILVVLVAAQSLFPGGSSFARELKRLHPAITSIVLNINPKRTSVVLGKEEKILYGPGFIWDELMGLSFRISPSSFYQVNPSQTEVLYGEALEMAALSGKERVLDAYCGIGTIGLLAAGRAKEVIGVESNGDAVKDAVRNAKVNKIGNVRFLQGDAGAYMVELAEAGETLDVVLMDPPRSGSDEAFLGALLRLAPKKVVYISCNPHTQERDLAVLTQGGYRVEAIRPVDMFPHTLHVETVVLMSRKDK